MELQYETHLTARILLTIVTFFFGIIPSIADFNKTHATNPLWTGHARFHVVWQCLSYQVLAAFSLYLIWLHPGDAGYALNFSMVLALAVFLGFWATLLNMDRFGGEPYDENGYPPIPVQFLGRTINIERNITAFGIAHVPLLIAFLLVNF